MVNGEAARSAVCLLYLSPALQQILISESAARHKLEPCAVCLTVVVTVCDGRRGRRPQDACQRWQLTAT